MVPVISFELPARLEAGGPPERFGTLRDQVRMMVGRKGTGAVSDHLFSEIGSFLDEGDVLVINTSATLPAAVPATAVDGIGLLVHFSSPTANGRWIVEVRSPHGFGSTPGPGLDPQTLDLEGGARIVLTDHLPGSSRLWLAEPVGTGNLLGYLSKHGRPIRYPYAGGDWPLSDYQTVYALEPGSAEMPSAGRPFTTGILSDLVARGVSVVPVLLHAGVASLEAGEHPGPERFRVPTTTAATINLARRNGGRVVAVGTTVVRALESAVAANGAMAARSGFTDLIVTTARGVSTVDGLLTGWHEPRASHLDLIEAVAGVGLTTDLYQHALDQGYLWHEFGDSCLILP